MGLCSYDGQNLVTWCSHSKVSDFTCHKSECYILQIPMLPWQEELAADQSCNCDPNTAMHFSHVPVASRKKHKADANFRYILISPEIPTRTVVIPGSENQLAAIWQKNGKGSMLRNAPGPLALGLGIPKKPWERSFVNAEAAFGILLIQSNEGTC